MMGVKRYTRAIATSLLLLLGQFTHMPAASAGTIVMDTLNGGTCVNQYTPPNQWAHRFISGGGTITQIKMMVYYNTAFWSTSKIQIRGENGSVPGSVLATFDAVSYSGNLVTYTGSFTSSATTKFWVNPYSPSNPLGWCYFQANGGTTTSASGWSFDPTNTSTSKGLASTADYVTWGVGGGGFQIQYEFQTGTATDTTAPTFSAPTTFSVAENSTSVGTVSVNESSTITIDSGEDKLKFSLTRSSETSAALSFVSAPNYESPTDVGANNSYIVVLKAVDSSSNAKLETFTVNVTDVVETSSLSSFAITGNARTAIYKSPTTITAVSTIPAKITFRWNGKVIAGCASKLTTGSAPTATATCTWKPSLHGSITLTATSIPTNSNFTGAFASLPISITGRSGTR